MLGLNVYNLVFVLFNSQEIIIVFILSKSTNMVIFLNLIAK